MTRSTGQPVIMTIAGLDPSGGAGVLADVKTISAFDCYGIAVVTSITVQNTQRVFQIQNQDAAIVRSQIEALDSDFKIAAIKTGMLPTSGIVLEAAHAIDKNNLIVVVDPVLISSSGFNLCDDGAIEAVKVSLFPLATVVTPNVAEAARLSGVDIHDEVTMRRAAEKILKMGAKSVLITGGDAGTSYATDFLLDSEGASTYRVERVVSTNTHGTGCTLASAIACLLVQGHSLREAVPLAKQYIADAIRSAHSHGCGDGPLNHFSRLF
jgi:hydroxymethylpyrimidine kinase/phosphomethylpyrimidine kinase